MINRHILLKDTIQGLKQRLIFLDCMQGCTLTIILTTALPNGFNSLPTDSIDQNRMKKISTQSELSAVWVGRSHLRGCAWVFDFQFLP